MKIKTLDELELQFEVISKKEQRQYLGGYGKVILPSGEIIDLDDSFFYTGSSNFIDDGNPNTLGGGHFTTWNSNHVTSTTLSTGYGDQNISLFGYGEDGMPIYLDSINGGYLRFNDQTHLTIIDQISDSTTVAQGDYNIFTNISRTKYFDNILGGYITQSAEPEVQVVYTGYQTTATEIERKRILEEMTVAQKLKETTYVGFSSMLPGLYSSQILKDRAQWDANPETTGTPYKSLLRRSLEKSFPNVYSNAEVTNVENLITTISQVQEDNPTLPRKLVADAIKFLWDSVGHNITEFNKILYGNNEIVFIVQPQ